MNNTFFCAIATTIVTFSVCAMELDSIDFDSPDPFPKYFSQNSRSLPSPLPLGPSEQQFLLCPSDVQKHDASPTQYDDFAPDTTLFASFFPMHHQHLDTGTPFDKITEEEEEEKQENVPTPTNASLEEQGSLYNEHATQIQRTQTPLTGHKRRRRKESLKPPSAKRIRTTRKKPRKTKKKKKRNKKTKKRCFERIINPRHYLTVDPARPNALKIQNRSIRISNMLKRKYSELNSEKIPLMKELTSPNGPAYQRAQEVIDLYENALRIQHDIVKCTCQPECPDFLQQFSHLRPPQKS